MTPAECAKLILKCSAYDNRKLTEPAAAAWAESIDPDVKLQDALDAIAAHYAEGETWIMPAHVNTRARAVRRERLQRAGTPPMPDGLTHADEKVWRQLWCSAVKDNEPDPVAVANRAMRLTPRAIEGSPVPQDLRDNLIAKLARSKEIPKEVRPRRKRIEYVDDRPKPDEAAS